MRACVRVRVCVVCNNTTLSVASYTLRETARSLHNLLLTLSLILENLAKEGGQ